MSQPRVFALVSGKGGVGKSTLAANWGWRLAEQGYGVTLIDADRGLADLDVILGLDAKPGLGSQDCTPTPVAEGLTLFGGVSGAYSEALWGQTFEVALGAAGDDTVLIDTGSALDDGLWTAIAAADVAVLVLTPEPASLADAVALLGAARQQGVVTQWAVVVNQVRNEGAALALHQRIQGAVSAAWSLKLPFLGWVPSDAAVSEATRRRQAFAARSPKCPAALGLDRLIKASEAWQGVVNAEARIVLESFRKGSGGANAERKSA